MISDLMRHLLVTIVTSVVTFVTILVTIVTFLDAYWRSTLESHHHSLDRGHWLNAGQL
jgi:hypothetical protein